MVIPTETGPQRYLQVAARMAAAPAISSFAICLQTDELRVGTGIGGGPVPVPAKLAELYLSDWLQARGQQGWLAELPPPVVARFGDLASSAVAPLDDGRAPASYRRQVVGAMARRTLLSCWADVLGERS